MSCAYCGHRDCGKAWVCWKRYIQISDEADYEALGSSVDEA